MFKNIPKPVLIFLIADLIILLVALLPFFASDSERRATIKQEQKWLAENNELIQYAFTDLLPRAKECALKGTLPVTFGHYKDHCKGEVRKRMDTILGETLSDKFDNRNPMYFIRLQDHDHIEKLFQSGTYFVDEVNTPGERSVVNMLEGKQDTFPFPLYTCNGGDDFLCIPIIQQLFPRIYLKDFPSEIEFIHLVRNNENETLGAIVSLYGD